MNQLVMAAEVNIPRLDLDDYIKGTPEQRKQFSDNIGKAFNDTGFVTIANHGMTQELINDLYTEVKQFFGMPDEQKLKYEIAELAGQRGYTSKGREKAKDSNTPDLKEFWQSGQVVTDGDPVKEEYPDNVQVNELPGFNRVTREVYQRLEYAGKHLLRAIAVYLHLPENYFDDKVHNSCYGFLPYDYNWECRITGESGKLYLFDGHHKYDELKIIWNKCGSQLQWNKNGQE
jgi:isopenicillin N synthase-like dioxygenase